MFTYYVLVHIVRTYASDTTNLHVVEHPTKLVSWQDYENFKCTFINYYRKILDNDSIEYINVDPILQSDLPPPQKLEDFQ